MPPFLNSFLKNFLSSFECCKAAYFARCKRVFGGTPGTNKPFLQCCVTSRWGIQQTGSGWGGAVGTVGTVGTVSTGGSWAPRCKQACWAQGQRGMFAVLRYQPLGSTANRLWLGRRYGNYGNCGICGICGELGAAMQIGLLGAENKQAFLHRTPANRLKIPLGNALTKQACWAQKTNKPFCIVPRPIG